ncbi:hypothetical protein NL676_000451 [Syzygium grande]|nr:hypothetical protein NL676_000451 [Syzygium grande]
MVVWRGAWCGSAVEFCWGPGLVDPKEGLRFLSRVLSVGCFSGHGVPWGGSVSASCVLVWRRSAIAYNLRSCELALLILPALSVSFALPPLLPILCFEKMNKAPRCHAVAEGDDDASASGKIFPLTPTEEQAVRGIRRKLDAESSSSESCAFKRRRDAQFHPSPFERSFSAVSPICSQVGDGMDMS